MWGMTQPSVLDFMEPEESLEVRLQDALDLLQSLDEHSVPLVVTDPPYGISYQSNHRKGAKSAPVAQDWNFQIGPFLDEVSRVLKPEGSAYIFTRLDVYPLWARSDVYPLWARSVPPTLHLKNLIVWDKGNHSAGDLTGNFGFRWEAIMFLVPAEGRHTLRGTRWPNLWTFPRVSSAQQIHPAEKPVGLLQRIINSSTDPGDIVVDPFCGSGSTGEAALMSGRKALLGDIDKRVLVKTLERLRLPMDESLREPPRVERDADLPICPSAWRH